MGIELDLLIVNMPIYLDDEERPAVHACWTTTRIDFGDVFSEISLALSEADYRIRNDIKLANYSFRDIDEKVVTQTGYGAKITYITAEEFVRAMNASGFDFARDSEKRAALAYCRESPPDCLIALYYH
jgi:hypothetical protein